MDPKVPAFPGAESQGRFHNEGISIRNYIAIEAMKALIPIYQDHSNAMARPASVSEDAYIYADALIAESNKK